MKYPASYFKEPEVLFVCDHETTGFDPWYNEIITSSIGSYDYKSLELLDEIELKFKPQNLKYYGGVEVHGIPISEAINFPNKADSNREMLDFFIKYKSDHNAFLCHALERYNTYFDWAFLYVQMMKFDKEYLLRRKVNKLESTIDYFKEASKQGKVSLANYKLNTICDLYNVDLNHHDAKSDRVACFEIYKKARSL